MVMNGTKHELFSIEVSQVCVCVCAGAKKKKKNIRPGLVPSRRLSNQWDKRPRIENTRIINVFSLSLSLSHSPHSVNDQSSFY